MLKGVSLLRSAALALLALAVISGGSFAAGDLFDDDYRDCPVKTRLREGQISDLTVTRDADDEDNVSWEATNPATWGLGANAYSTSLVVILDDGKNHTKTLSLGTRKVTFDGIETGRKVQVQLAIVVDTADGDYLISDILETSINQSVTEPSFSTGWNVKATYDNPDTADTDESTADTAVPEATMYYIGYNENFGNYRARPGLTVRTKPSTPRLRIGLAHSVIEDNDARDAVDFEAYILRLLDSDGDVIPESDNVATVGSGPLYGMGAVDTNGDGDTTDPGDSAANELVLDVNYANNFTATAFTGLVNVRVKDGDDITPAMYHSSVVGFVATFQKSAAVKAVSIEVDAPAASHRYAAAPDEHRDFPIDVFPTDGTYTVEAWAVNDDGEVISPVVKLKMHPTQEPALTLSSANRFGDYLNASAASGTLKLTEFTVFK